MGKYDLGKLDSSDPDVKYGEQKRILRLSQTDPQALYPDFDYFAQLIDSPNNIYKWTGILVIGNLASVDAKNKIMSVLPKVISQLNVGKMITAGNAIRALAAIAQARPEMANELALEIIKVEGYRYDTVECQNIAIGHALKNISAIYPLLDKQTQKAVINFASRSSTNSRPATAKKAKELLEKMEES